MRILVIGGAGFIGSHYVRALLDNEYPEAEEAQVTVLDALGYAGRRANLPEHHPRLVFVQGDILDMSLLLDVIPGHDAVVNFAAESHVDRSIKDAGVFIRTNVLGTQNLLEACRRSGAKRAVHVSTDEVYGSVESGSWTEESPLLPNSPYAASKASSDLVARAYWRTYGLNVSVTRCCNNYGPYQHPEKLIPLFTTNLIEGRPLPLYGDGSNVREWLHVDDHCRAIQSVLAHGKAGAVYNVGGGEERTNREIAECLVRLAGADWSMIQSVPDRPGHDMRYSLNGTKIKEELGYEPRIAWERGLAQTFAWYRDNPTWWKPIKRGERT